MSKYNYVINLRINGTLTLLFVGLKLAKVITWSWWWVMAPIWIPMCLLLLMFIIIGTVYWYVNK